MFSDRIAMSSDRIIIWPFNQQELDECREDTWKILSRSPDEVPGVLRALRAGKIDGTLYSGSAGSCLIGTICKLQGYELRLNVSRHHPALRRLGANPRRPAERFFLRIAPCFTPDICPYAAIAEAWILEWQAMRGEGELIGRRRKR